LIAPAVPARGGRWADLGAGAGTFTEALARLLGPEGSVIAVDRERGALAKLRRLAERPPASAAPVVVIEGDLSQPLSSDLLHELDGVLIANVLHFFEDPTAVLEHAIAMLRETGRIVVLEYDGVAANQWVPYPVSLKRLGEVARGVGMGNPTVTARRPSRFRGTLYCAVLERAG
jgi:ubiquinone/menaquinone biosynthesis C-methylase UbiE